MRSTSLWKLHCSDGNQGTLDLASFSKAVGTRGRFVLERQEDFATRLASWSVGRKACHGGVAAACSMTGWRKFLLWTVLSWHPAENLHLTCLRHGLKRGTRFRAANLHSSAAALPCELLLVLVLSPIDHARSSETRPKRANGCLFLETRAMASDLRDHPPSCDASTGRACSKEVGKRWLALSLNGSLTSLTAGFECSEPRTRCTRQS